MRTVASLSETSPVPRDLLSGLPDDERRALWSVMRRCRFRRGEIVFRDGDAADSVHFIVKGHFAARVTTPAGDTVILRILGRDDLLGEYALLRSARRAATVVAIDAAETMMLHDKHFARIRKEHELIDQMLLDATVREIRRLSDALVDALHLPAERRVLRRLAEAAVLWHPGDEIPLSQQELAELAGVTRQSANKVLKKSQEEGLIHLGRGCVVVPDVDALARASS
jgi:CRP-like cAMP-binding protein